MMFLFCIISKSYRDLAGNRILCYTKLEISELSKSLNSIDLNGAGRPSWVHLLAKSRAAPDCAPKRLASQPRTPFLSVFSHFRVYRQSAGRS